MSYSYSLMEQGELEASPDLRHSPDVEILADDEVIIDSSSPVAHRHSPVSHKRRGSMDREDNEEALHIKPPPIPAKKEKHKHKHKEDKKRDREREKEKSKHGEREREKDRDRGKHRDRRDNEKPPKDIFYEERAREREREREGLRRKELENKEAEEKRREKSRKERERLERLERERRKLEREREQREREHKERLRVEQQERLRVEQERLAQAKRDHERLIKEERDRKRKDVDVEERRSHSTRHEIERRRPREKVREERPQQRREKKRVERSRSRSPHFVRKESKNRYEDKEERYSHESRKYGREIISEKSKQEEYHREHDDEDDYHSHSHDDAHMEEEERSEPEQEESSSATSSESESEDSDSDSAESDTEQSNISQNTPVHSDGEDQEDDEYHEQFHPKVRSKFDDNVSENESVVSSVQQHTEDEEDDEEYIQETPPESPVELAPDLPAYYPAIQGCRNVDEFHCLNKIEEGTYGVVYRARDKKTSEIVALKRLKMEKEKEGFPITSLREINTLLKAQHVNIVTVREIVVGSNMDKIYLVMDYVEHDLKSLMYTMKENFIIGEVKTLMMQLLRGVAHLHDNWIIHRDLKTSNLLLSHKGILKIGDFGLAREYGSPLKEYTSIVVTLWYRAPELLLGTKQYSVPIDMWSVGCIFAEFLTKKPLFPGKSEIDQLNRIFKELGTPTEKIWPGVGELSVMKKCTFADYPYNQLRNKFSSMLTDKGFDLMNRFLTYDPTRRITAEEAYRHTFFSESPLPVDPSMFPTWPAKSEQMPRTHGNTPKPPSGGKAYGMLLGDDDEALAAGFHLATSTKGAAASGIGFSLKFTQ